MCLIFTYLFGVLCSNVCMKQKIHDIDDLRKCLMQTCFDTEQHAINAVIHQGVIMCACWWWTLWTHAVKWMFIIWFIGTLNCETSGSEVGKIHTFTCIVHFWTTVCKTVHPIPLDHCPGCLSVCVSVCDVGWIKIKLGPGHVVLDGDSTPPKKEEAAPTFWPMYCAQTSGWIKVPRYPQFSPMSIMVKRSPISATAEHLLVDGQVTIIFVVSVCLSVCLFVQSFSQQSSIRFGSN